MQQDKMKERPILFNGAMVRAILGGTKTQTRRVIKDQSIGNRFSHMTDDGMVHLEWLGDPRCGTGVWDVPEYSAQISSPYGKPGDQLWVRETFGHFERNDTLKPGDTIYYRADGECIELRPWRPSIHMPRWASRITLEVTGVRVERLHDISEEDALAEGVGRPIGGCWFNYLAPTPLPTGRESFRSLWQYINGPGSWDANPWVWVIGFKRLVP